MTLDELITELTKDGKRPDEFRVRAVDHKPGYWFRPYFKANGRWHGVDDSGSYWWSGLDDDTFELYTEPKPKVKRAQYLLAYPGVNPFITDQLYIDEKQVRDQMAKNLIICERLTETEREFDE